MVKSCKYKLKRYAFMLRIREDVAAEIEIELKIITILGFIVTGCRLMVNKDFFLKIKY